MHGSIEGKTCLVTGGAGFLGRNLCAALVRRGCAVRVLDRAPAHPDFAGALWVQGDIQNQSDVQRAVSGCEIVFHTAAIIETLTHAPQRFKTQVWNVNVEGTRVLLQACQDHNVKRFVHTSSTNVVLGQNTVAGDERSPYSTSIDLYSSTKAEAERIVLDADSPGSMRTCALRPGGIYGPGERTFMIGPITDALRKRMPLFVIGNGKSLLDYVYIDNLIDAQLRAADLLNDRSAVCGRAYFISDDSPINPGQFSIVLAQNMNLPARVVHLRRPLARLLAWVWERWFQCTNSGKALLTLVGVDLCTRDNYFSIAAAKRDLGYVPLCTTEEGLRRTAVEGRSYYDSLQLRSA